MNNVAEERSARPILEEIRHNRELLNQYPDSSDEEEVRGLETARKRSKKTKKIAVVLPRRRLEREEPEEDNNQTVVLSSDSDEDTYTWPPLLPRPSVQIIREHIPRRTYT